MKTLAEINKEIADIKSQLADVHGTETEVYARIVGYYRAVKNWNKGKAEEFTQRKNFVLQDSSEFDIHRYADANEIEPTTFSPESEMLDEMTIEEDAAPAQDLQEPQGQERGQAQSEMTYELFARKTCPNCPPVKEWIHNSGLKGTTVDVDTEAGLSQAAQKGVFAAPTVIFYNADGSEKARAHSVSELEEIFAVATA